MEATATKSQIPKRNHPKSHRQNNAKLALIKLLAEYFCLRTQDLALLRFGAFNKNTSRTTNYTLKLLCEMGLLRRIPYYDLRYDRAPKQFVYGLTDKGCEEALKHYDFHPKTFDEHSDKTIEHELELSYFHIRVARLCKEQRWILKWRQYDLKHKIHPDAFFTRFFLLLFRCRSSAVTRTIFHIQYSVAACSLR